MSVRVVKSKKVTVPKLKRVHSVHPWEVQHYDNYSAISAYVEITGQVEIIAVMQGINHAAIAQFIATLANAHNQKPALSGTIQDTGRHYAQSR